MRIIQENGGRINLQIPFKHSHVAPNKMDNVRGTYINRKNKKG